MNPLFLLVALLGAVGLILLLRRGVGTGVRFDTVTGEVTGLSTYASTDVEGWGGGPPGGPASVTITSSSTTHREFFLRGDDGVEMPVHMWGFDVPLANGQRVTLLRALKGERARHALLVNHNARRAWDLFHDPVEVLQALRAVLPLWLAAGLAVLAGLGAVAVSGAAAEGSAGGGSLAGVMALVAAAVFALLYLARRLRARALAAQIRARRADLLAGLSRG